MRKVILIGLLASLGGVLFAQGTQVSEDPLLAEVRALRAEVHQIASASIRTQLLVARLQLQEQRVLMAGRQLLEVQNALATTRQEMAGEEARVEQLEKSSMRDTSQGQAQVQQAVLGAKAQIEQLRRQEQQLQAREMECLEAANNAQRQWIDFGARLDAVERSVPAYIKPVR
jgi:hypothetical protein